MCTHVYTIYRHVAVYIHGHIPTDLAVSILFPSGSHERSTLPPNVGAFGSNSPHHWLLFLNRSYEHVPMDRGIILCFLCTIGFDLFLQVGSSFVLRKHWSPCWLSICKDPSSWVLGKDSYILRKALIFGKGVYIPEEGVFLRLLLWKYGGLDIASSANRVC